MNAIANTGSGSNMMDWTCCRVWIQTYCSQRSSSRSAPHSSSATTSACWTRSSRFA